MSLRDRMKEKTAGIAAAVDQKMQNSPASSDKTVTMPGRLSEFRNEALQYQKRIDDLGSELEKAKQSSGSINVAISDLYEVPGRRRQLTPDEYSDLRDNLKNNPLAHAITIRKRPDGCIPKWEIISGYNRTAIYRDEFKKEHIRADIIECDDTQAELTALFANLFQTNLSDFEAYTGFKNILTREPHFEYEDIAKLSGKNISYVKKVMSFGELPEKAIELIKSKPFAVGSNAAQSLAALAKKGRASQVVVAIEKIIAGELEQNAAVKFAASGPAKVKAGASTDEKLIKSGNATYCSMRRADKVLRLEFKTHIEAELIFEEVRKILEKRSLDIKEKKP